MILSNADDVTQAALAVMARTGEPRLREIMVALIRHLHAFVRDARLTEAEFRQGIAILNDIGALASDTHNEMMLMAGSLGVSSLVCLLNNGDNGATETTQSLLGPFWRLHSPPVENGGSILRSPTPGPVLLVNGRVVDHHGSPVAGARVDVWHASPAGLYENQDRNQADMNLRGTLMTDDDGRFWFQTVKMVGYAIPTDGVVGRLLAAQDRHPYRPAHLHVLVCKDGFKVQTSQVYADDDPYLESDVQFGVTRALVGNFQRHDETCPDRPDIAAPWYSLDHVFTLEPGIAVLPRPPIK